MIGIQIARKWGGMKLEAGTEIDEYESKNFDTWLF